MWGGSSLTAGRLMAWGVQRQSLGWTCCTQVPPFPVQAYISSRVWEPTARMRPSQIPAPGMNTKPNKGTKVPQEMGTKKSRRRVMAPPSSLHRAVGTLKSDWKDATPDAPERSRMKISQPSAHNNPGYTPDSGCPQGAGSREMNGSRVRGQGCQGSGELSQGT